MSMRDRAVQLTGWLESHTSTLRNYPYLLKRRAGRSGLPYVRLHPTESDNSHTQTILVLTRS
jgi:hypothetical protein